MLWPLVLLLMMQPLYSSCQAKKAAQTRTNDPLPAQTLPMFCRIEGKILSYMKPSKSEEGDCARHPCLARVQILAVDACGSSVTIPVNVGDTMDIRFAYTLHPTARIYPRMKEKLPGLKPGNVFAANAQARITMGSGGEFVVWSYRRK